MAAKLAQLSEPKPEPPHGHGQPEQPALASDLLAQAQGDMARYGEM